MSSVVMELSCREDGLLDVSLEMEVRLLRDGLYSMLPSHHMVPIDSSPFPGAWQIQFQA